MTHVAKFSLKLKKVGKTTRTFRYDLNQFPYDYTVEAMNKGLNLVETQVPEEPWTKVGNIVQEAVAKAIPEKNARRQSGCLRRLYK